MQGIHAANRLLHFLMVIWQRQDTLVLLKKTKTNKKTNTIIPATTTLRIYNRGPTFMCAEETRKIYILACCISQCCLAGFMARIFQDEKLA